MSNTGAGSSLQSGNASGATATRLTDNTRTWAPSQWNGMILIITGGKGEGQSLPILGTQNNNTLTLNGMWQTVPDNTSTYEIQAPDSRMSLFVVKSSDGGQTFSWMETLDQGIVDKPWIATGPGGALAPQSVWVSWSDTTGRVSLAGAGTTRLNGVRPFTVNEKDLNSQGLGLSSVAVGPNGQVLLSYQQTASGPSTQTIFSDLDPDGLGSAGFVGRRTVTDTRVSNFLKIPAQQERGIFAGSLLAWDRSSAIHSGPNGRVYLVYTDRATLAPNDFDTNIFIRYSDDSGATWSSSVQVNDTNSNSQFMPTMAVDQGTGDLAVAWYDARNDAINSTVDLYTTVSDNGGLSFPTDTKLSAGRSSAHDAGRSHFGTATGGTLTTLTDTSQNWEPNHWAGHLVMITAGRGAGQSGIVKENTANTLTLIDPGWPLAPDATSTYMIDPPYHSDFGEYVGLAYGNGVFYPAWADNTDSTADNPDGNYHDLDIYSVPVFVTHTAGGQAPLVLSETNPLLPTLGSNGVLSQPEMTPAQMELEIVTDPQLVSAAMTAIATSLPSIPSGSVDTFSAQASSEPEPTLGNALPPCNDTGVLDNFFSNYGDESGKGVDSIPQPLDDAFVTRELTDSMNPHL